MGKNFWTTYVSRSVHIQQAIMILGRSFRYCKEPFATAHPEKEFIDFASSHARLRWSSRLLSIKGILVGKVRLELTILSALAS